MSFTKTEALAHMDKQVQLCDLVDEDGTGGMRFSSEVAAGTNGHVIHANLHHRFSHPEYDPTDMYEVVIEWDLPDRRIDMLGKTEYATFITDLA